MDLLDGSIIEILRFLSLLLSRILSFVSLIISSYPNFAQTVLLLLPFSSIMMKNAPNLLEVFFSMKKAILFEE